MSARHLLVVFVTSFVSFLFALYLLSAEAPTSVVPTPTPLLLQEINDPTISNRCVGYGEEDYCVRKLLIAPTLGIQVIAHDIALPDTYEYFESENALLAKRPTNPESFNGPLLLSVHKSETDETIEAAITRVATTDLPYAVGYEGCTVIKSINPRIVAPPGSTVYEYVATPRYQEIIDAAYKKFDGKPPFDECGPYSSAGEGVRYFIFHPAEASSTFVFFNGTMDYPLDLVDPASVKILRTN